MLFCNADFFFQVGLNPKLDFFLVDSGKKDEKFDENFDEKF